MLGRLLMAAYVNELYSFCLIEAWKTGKKNAAEAAFFVPTVLLQVVTQTQAECFYIQIYVITIVPVIIDAAVTVVLTFGQRVAGIAESSFNREVVGYAVDQRQLQATVIIVSQAKRGIERQVVGNFAAIADSHCNDVLFNIVITIHTATLSILPLIAEFGVQVIQ